MCGGIEGDPDCCAVPSCWPSWPAFVRSIWKSDSPALIKHDTRDMHPSIYIYRTYGSSR